ncbi:ABC transporter substrate-binding protein [Streptomyces brasiliensis]|uniref:Taurine ABC transporter substrate-binding protein n=1 Tax=Streptomyces brasiliensis TaxID=1954 RepID=A0A917UNI0_9ACTN|nr:ABC transporter substrate-binding protein [Streptomyces brasiliensis]GGJ70623.1 taurine ABC transporter substrate-binding protein [Streptomyces brasiliensis]
MSVRNRTTPTRRLAPVRRLLSATALAAALALAATGCGGKANADNSAPKKGTLRVGVIGSKAELTGPIGFLNSEKKLLPGLKAEGFDKIEVFPFPNGPDLNQALVGGSLDVASYGDTPALVARGSGLDTRLISMAAIDSDASIVVKKNGPKTLEDLQGKKIGVQTGSYIHRYLLGALQDAKVKPAEVVHIYNADIEAPLERGDIAAAAVPQANAEVFKSKGYQIIDHLLEDHPDYAGTNATVSTDKFLDAHPKFAATWQQLQNSGVKDARAHWSDYVDYSVALSGFPADLVRPTIRKEQLPDTAFPERGLALLESTKKFLVEQKFIKKDFSVDDWRVGGAK